MSPATPSRASTSALAETASSTLSLLRGFSTLLSIPPTFTFTSTSTKENPSPIPPTANIPADAPNPLHVLHTSATLLKAHTTKLSLLLINTPFTPSEIKKIISDGIANTCIPAMMGAVEICAPEVWGRSLSEEVRVRVRKVFVELESLMGEVLKLVSLSRVEGAGAVKNDVGHGDGEGRNTLLSTGVVWEACDALMELKVLGVAGITVRRAQEYREMLEDALAELKEWAEEEEDDDDDYDEDGERSDGEIFELNGSIPKDQPELRAALEVSMKRLKLISTLYQALGKRRLKTFGAGTEALPEKREMERLDNVMHILKQIPDQADEMAGAFYELDKEEAQRRTEDICKSGSDAIELVKLDWKGVEDEFTAWAGKWLAAVERS